MISQIRKIDNTRSMPRITFVIVGILLLIGYWFIRGGSFKLYASMFFGLYFATHVVWLSIILVSLIQNIAFLPLRMIGEKLLPDFKDFEEALEKTKNEEQGLLVKKRMREGDASVLVYILNFVLVAIAFVSAGRVFLLDFYYEKISTHYLYNFIPYPDYPLQGTTFYFPFLKITKTTALPWSRILAIWLLIIGLMVVLRILWRVLRRLLWKNKQVLSVRIAYNKILMGLGGIAGVLLIASAYFLRHIPVGFSFLWLTADLSRQNTTFNIVTAVATFLATIYLGYKHNREAAEEAQKRGVEKEMIAKAMKVQMRVSLRNAFFLAIFAYWLTHQMPSSHDLSVLAFESIYILAPYTLDAFIMKKMLPTANKTV
ncbi:hypothetical protein M1116_02620 [Patescibacteria group bacterium]|nr:hypothetical protein [Patescibacteria group bacterium]